MPKVKRDRTRAPKKTDDLAFGLMTDALPTEFDGMTRAQTRQAEKDRRKKAADEAAAAAAKLRAEFAAQRKPKGAALGDRGDGAFHISFVQMGQGDCTIMSTPDGTVLLVDCGTNSSDGETDDVYNARVRAELEALPYLRNTKVIDIVILSHPDKDHYNRLETMLPKGYTAYTIYHSGTFSDYGAGSRWSRARIKKESLIKKVVLSEDAGMGENSLAGKPIDPVFGTDQLERLDASNGLRIVSEPNCVITLLAAGVQQDYAGDSDSADHTNRGSIVTLIELFGNTKKILLCADATRSTEQFVLKNASRAARLASVDIVQAGHHGSDVTSSGQVWVDALKPKAEVVVSAGQVGVPNHHLPSAKVIKRWNQRFVDDGRTADTTAHKVSAWDTTVNMYKPLVVDVDQPVYTTGSNGTQIFTFAASS